MMKKVLFFAGLAAAVLSLVGCNKEADFFGRNGRKMQIVLTDATTRTVNDGLATKWVDGDALNVFYALAGTTDYSENTKFEVDDAASNHATGTADLTAKAYDWYLLYPYDSHIKTPASTNSGYVTIGCRSDKTQSQAGLDDMAHLAGANLPVYGVAKNVSSTVTPEVAMKQVASVVAVNLTNATDKALKVDAVSFAGPEDIVGTFYLDFTGEELAFVSSGANYVSKTATLDVAGEETIAAGASAKFYIAIKPFAAKANDVLTVKIHSGELIFEKTLTLPSAVEFKSGVIKQLNVSYTGGSEIPAYTLEEIAAMDKDTDIQTAEVLVVAKYARGVMLAQDGFYLLAFDNAGVNAAIGDIVTVSGKVGEYAGLKQIASPVVELVSSDNEVVLPEPKVLDGLDEYSSDKVELIQYSGTLAVSGNYFNVKVDGSNRQGSIQYPLDADALKALDKKPITATGFFTGITGSDKYVNMMSTSVVAKEGNVFDVTPTQINVPAVATSATINVTGNVDWTAEASDGASVNPASGNGDGTITVTFAANTDSDNTKEYTVFVRTEAEGVNDEFEVNITQAKAVSGNYFVHLTDGADFEDGLYLIVYKDGSLAMSDAEDASGNTVAVTIVGDAIEATDEVKLHAFGITVDGGYIQGPNGKYIGQTSDANGMKVSDGAIENSISFDADGNACIVSGGAYLRYNANSGQERFRYFKSATYTAQKAIQLFKLSGGVTPPPAAALESIAVSGQKTVFTVGDTFAFDGKVTATYSNGSTKDVTASAKVSSPDLSSAGTKEVTVSYTENEVTKTAKYNITVKTATAHAGTLEDPYTVADALTAAEALGEGKTSSDKYYVKGLVSEAPAAVSNGKATYFISDDGTATGKMKVYNGFYIGGASFSSADQLQAGDEVIVHGKLQYYKPSSGDSELEISSSSIYSLKRGGVEQYAFSGTASTERVSSAASTVKINVYGNVDWTASVTSPATIDASSGSGSGTITVSIPENTSTTNERPFVVTVARLGTDEKLIFTIYQDKKDASGAVTITGTSAAGAGMTDTRGEQQCTIDGVTIVITDGIVSGDQIRIYKNASITVSAPSGKNLKKVVFTCTASGTAQYGPGCFAEHDGYSFADTVGTWEGTANSLTLTASSAQVRATSIVVTLE